MIFRRVIAYLIDYILLWIIIMLFYFLGSVVLKRLPAETSEIIFLVLFYLAPLFIMVYMSFKDFLFRDASIGKKIMQIHVVSIVDNKKTLSKQLILRNLFGVFLLPIEGILVLSGQRRLGDSYANTAVVMDDEKRT